MQSLPLNNHVIRLKFFHFGIKTKKIWISFLMFCLQIIKTFSTHTISTIINCVSVLESSLINMQNRDMIDNFQDRIKTGKQRNIRLLENVINSSIVMLS